MNPHIPYAPSFTPGTARGLPLQPYRYGVACPPSQPQQPQDAQLNDSVARPPEGYAPPFAPHPGSPPLILPIYSLGIHPFGYPGVFAPNYAMYLAPNGNTGHISPSPSPHPPYSPHPGSTSSPYTSSHSSSDRQPSAGPQWMPSPASSRSGTPSAHRSQNRTTGRYGINELLNCQLDRHPFIDWVIYDDLSLARQWVRSNSGMERCQAVVFDSLAVVPPVNNLCIKSTSIGLDTPIGQALQRWGDIRVCRFDRFLSAGDVLHEIWAYFQTPLTEEEKATMLQPFASRVEEYFQKRWNAQGKVPEQAVKRRSDTLLGCVRFAGLGIGFDFERCRELYLSLELASLK